MLHASSLMYAGASFSWQAWAQKLPGWTILRTTPSYAEGSRVGISCLYFFRCLNFFHVVAHKIYGIPQTINSANYVYFLAYQELFALRRNSPKTSNLDALVTCQFLSFSVTSSFAKSSQAELLSLHRGQGLEILWRDSLRCPTEEEYIHMVNNSEKTGYMYQWCF